nr:MAG TPA: RNA polymerase subunit [Caudoviricetes sp.]
MCPRCDYKETINNVLHIPIGVLGIPGVYHNDSFCFLFVRLFGR